jgi:FkbM family methyltransferase
MASLLSRMLRPHKNRVQRRLARVCERLHGRCVYSQDGEDLLVDRLLAMPPGTPGFYVDVGAHHPERLSNTFFFYLRGWRGINIDAMPGSMDAFREMRPRDINVERAISDVRQTLTYYTFSESSLNGFNAELSKERDGQKEWSRLLGTREIETVTLADVLDEHLPPGQRIDFLSVDVEGLDYQVLKSNNWAKYRPKLVLAEDLGLRSLEEPGESQVYRFMREQNYRLEAKTAATMFFMCCDADGDRTGGPQT